jgi:hypothetical protein
MNDAWVTGGLAIILCAVGLAFLIEAGHLVVTEAKWIARSYGVAEFVTDAPCRGGLGSAHENQSRRQ